MDPSAGVAVELLLTVSILLAGASCWVANWQSQINAFEYHMNHLARLEAGYDFGDDT